jgi:hypothetical protein
MSSRDEYVAVIKQAFITLGKKAAMEFIVAKIPQLGVGILGAVANPILGYFIGLALEGITTAAETAAFFLYIDMRVGQQGKDFEAAAYANYNAQRNGTPQEKANAEKQLKTALRKLVVLTN